MKGLDLRKFVKQSSDKKTTTLRHPDGHVITIAHSALSPEIQKELIKLPSNKIQKFDAGGTVNGETPEEAYPDQTTDTDTSASSVGPSENLPDPSTQQPGPIPEALPAPNQASTSDSAATTSSDIPQPSKSQVDFTTAVNTAYQNLGINPSAPDKDQQLLARGLTPQDINVSAQNILISSTKGKIAANSTALSAAQNKWDAQNKQNQDAASLGIPTIDIGPRPGTPIATTSSDIPQPSESNNNNTSNKNVDYSRIPQPLGNRIPNNSNNQTLPVISPQQQAFDEHQKETQAWQNDLANGHITPETYHDLFAKKDTLGKVGSIFGLLLGGMGAATTHSKNNALEMMNKEIANDLDAQKQSKQNAINFWNMNNQHEVQKAQITNLGAQTALAGSEAAKNQAFVRLLGGGSPTAGPKAYNQMSSVVTQDLQNQISKMPAGSQRDQAQAFLDQTVKPYFANKQQQNNVGMSQQVGDEQQEVNKLNNLERQAGAPDLGTGIATGARNTYSIEKDKYLPGVGMASKPVSETDQKSLTNYAKLSTDVDKAIELQNKFGVSGAWTPKSRADAESLKNELNVSLSALYDLKRINSSEYSNYGKQIGNIGGVNAGGTLEGLQNLKNEINSRKGIEIQHLGITPFKNPIGEQSTPSSSSLKEGQTGTSKSGKPMMVKNGKWVYQ